jgi:hypothetical protein
MIFRKIRLDAMLVDHLVGRFAAITAAQDDALLGHELTKFNRLFDRMMEVSNELKGRPGDQRRALTTLYDHPNMAGPTAGSQAHARCCARRGSQEN